MIIKTDVRNISFNSAPLTRNAPVVPTPRNNSESSRASMRTITERLGIERSLSDALSIAQMSQNVIQKAISISLRLKNIASTAMASGSVNNQALTEAMSDIRSAIGAYGEQVSNPVQPAATPAAKIIDMPDIRNTLSSVRDIAGAVQKGEYNQAEHIEAINKNLTDQLKNYRIAESRITDLMRESTAALAPNAGIRSGELVRQTTAAIQANPEYALSVQGNINHVTAERLMA
jgi:hypothetical protein